MAEPIEEITDKIHLHARLNSTLSVVQTDGAELTLLILPLKKSTIDGTADPELEGQVFIQQAYWPEYGGNESVLDLHGLSWVQTAHIPLAIY